MTLDYFTSLFLISMFMVPLATLCIRGLYSLFKELR